MAARKSRGKRQKSRRRKIVVKAGKPVKSAKFDNRRKALARVTAVAKKAMAKLPPGRATRIDVAVNPFRDAADSTVWLEFGPLWLEKNPTEGDQEVVG
jgi:hypothetical protein